MTDVRQTLYQDSLRVVADIAEAGSFNADGAWCCFHFLTDENTTEDEWEEAVETSRALFEKLPLKQSVDYIGQWAGIEAWKNVIPNLPGVQDSLPRLFDIADAAQLRFVGWTFEPKDPRHIFQASP